MQDIAAVDSPGAELPLLDADDDASESLQLLPAGQSCDSPEQCETGYCVDGVCCDSSCSGECESCDKEGSSGVCSPWDAQTDPELECGKCAVCDGAGECIMAVAGTDPKAACPTHQEVTCLLTGMCDGDGQCAYWSAETVCDSGMCFEGTLYPDDHCDGKGNCVDSPPVDCCPYQCDGDTCGVSCDTSEDCCEGFHCLAGSCV